MNDVVKSNEFSFQDVRSRLRKVLEENKNACVKINGRLEITRSVALALLNQLSRSIASIGGSVKIQKDVLNFSPVVVKSTCIIELPNGSVLEFQALGSAEESDLTGDKRIYHDTLGTAETRSLKRLLEETVGEDFINQVLAPLTKDMKDVNTERLATPKQKEWIKKLIKEKRIKDLKVEDVEKLSFKEAKEILDRAFKKAN